MKQNPSTLDAVRVTHSAPVFAVQNHSCIALHKLVGQVITDLPLQSIKQPGLIANNVQENLLVSTDKAVLGAIVKSLLVTVSTHSKDIGIEVSAKLIGSITVIHIKTNDSGQTEAIAKSFEKLQSMAQSIGGCITIGNGRFNGMNLAVTFINQ